VINVESMNNNGLTIVQVFYSFIIEALHLLASLDGVQSLCLVNRNSLSGGSGVFR